MKKIPSFKIVNHERQTSVTLQFKSRAGVLSLIRGLLSVLFWSFVPDVDRDAEKEKEREDANQNS